MNKNWISVLDELPEEGKYVIIHLNKTNWHDSSDPENVYFRIAKLCKGLSKSDRSKMKSGELPDGECIGYTYPNDVMTKHISKRSDTYKFGDEEANNLRPYSWKEFGINSYFGQEVDFWMPITPLGS